MIDFPEATRVHRRIPKEAFYRWMTLSADLKEKFVSDVDRIFVENSLTMENLRLGRESDVKEILLVSISLKKKEFDGKVAEAIARQNPHKLVFLLMYDSERQLALFHGRLYRSAWMPESETSLAAKGFSLEEIWEGFIVQIALCGERAETNGSLTIDQRLALQEKVWKLEKLIQKTEASAWKETQPKKRFGLYQKVQEYKRELEDLRDGQS